MLCGVLGLWAIKTGEEVFASGMDNQNEKVVFGGPMGNSLSVWPPVWGLEQGRSLRKLLRSWEMGRFQGVEDKELPQSLLEGCMCEYAQCVWGGHWRGQAGLRKVDTARVCPCSGVLSTCCYYPLLLGCSRAEAGLTRKWIRAARGQCHTPGE